MIKHKNKQRFYRIVSFFLLINILGDLVFPTCAMALTGGPSQPEFDSFEPAATNQMVDLFTGDFSYNIPLLNIPGPNGGYPVNLAYHAGPTMEQEASWVGLGWNINPGVVNRNMRGLPDDFNGDQVIKEYNLKPHTNFDFYVGLGEGEKLFGVPLTPNPYSLGITVDNYKGFGIAGSVSSEYISANYSTQDGMGLQLTPSAKIAGDLSLGLSVGLNSREGMTSWGVTVSDKYKVRGHTAGANANIGFAASTMVPTNNVPMNTELTTFDFKAGEELDGDFTYYSVYGSSSNTSVQSNYLTYNGYGYCYMQYNPKTQASGYLLDFNREGDYPITKDVEALPIPVMTNDIFMATGEGMGGAFRVQRSDVGILSDPQITNTTDASLTSLEVGDGDIVHASTSIPYLLNQKEVSGRWSDKYNQINGITDIDFTGGIDEPFSMKFLNELNTDDGAERGSLNTSVGGEALNINMTWDNVKKMFVPRVLNSFNGATNVPAYYGNPQYRTMRRKRDKSVEYRTRGELSSNMFSIGSHVVSGTPNYSNYTNYESGLNPYSYTGQSSSHFGEVSIVKPDGFRYQYGIPVYQQKQMDVVFSVNAKTTIGLGFEPYNNFENTYNTNVNPLHFNSGSASTVNNEPNTDQFFQRNTLPSYASNYLLTAVYSPDYVDLTGNGPSNDDIGYYVKYNYQKVYNNYDWRVPYTGVFLSKGDYSNIYDDKESYLYGQKEVWYLNSIETKTHIAIFYTSDRTDGASAFHEFSGSSSTFLGTDHLKKLDYINLYSQTDLTTPIQTVNFAYDYHLCPGVPNNSNTVQSGVAVLNTAGTLATNGKLTLTKIWFSYLGNNKGQLSPYEFKYEDTGTMLTPTSSYATSSTLSTSSMTDAFFQNPNYSANNNDRWGSFKVPYCQIGGSNAFNICGNDDYPYVDQDLDYNHDGALGINPLTNSNDETCDDNKQRNFHASAWSLRQITLPSGGQINIDYEQDDYAYVQNQTANDMFQIISTGQTMPLCTSGTGCPVFPGYSEDLDGNFRLYFPLKKDTVHGKLIDDITRYLPDPQPDGSQKISFKAFVELKNDLSFSYTARDYVEGYLDVVQSGTISTAGSGFFPYGNEIGFIDVNPVPVTNNTGACHPIQKASWQHLKLKRPDLLYPQTNTLSVGISLIQLVVSVLHDAESLILGFYGGCQTNDYAKKLELDAHGKPSFIRLKDPTGHKKGGGHRVRRITYSDNWNLIASDYNTANPDTYGQEYSYLLSDGRSSGVASYEPLQGGEENPFKQPSRTYSPINGPIPFKSRDLYIEKPYGEKYYPAPMVGYSRVIVKNIDRTIVIPFHATTKTVISNQQSLSGVSVTEFYTAKDFPIQVSYTGVNPATFAPPSIPIPLIGTLSWENRGYSQGFEIVLNNMHGQLKTQATYAPMYFSKTSWGTNMNSGAASAQAMVQYIYNTDANNNLNNNVTVLNGDGMYGTDLIGQSGEEFVDLRENSSLHDFSWTTINYDDWAVPPPTEELFWVMPWPTIDYSEKMFRSVVHNKVIYQTGILSQVITTKDGSSITMSNLMYDGTTGEPLLTSVTNNFDRPVYSYNKQASWAYNSMGPAYQNYRYSLPNVNASNGVFTVSNAIAANFHLGDMVEMGSSQYWVTSILASGTNNMKIALTDRHGNSSTTNGSITIIKSGYTNQQDLKMGHIVGLINPVLPPVISSGTGFLTSLQAAFISWATNLSTSYTYFGGNAQEALQGAETDFSGSFRDCEGNSYGWTVLSGIGTANWWRGGQSPYTPFANVEMPYFTLTVGSYNTILLLFPYGNFPTMGFLSNPATTISVYSSNQLSFHNPSFTPSTYIATTAAGSLPSLSYPTHAGAGPSFPPFVNIKAMNCQLLDSVLQSSAMHYTDQWSYNYADIGNPTFESYGLNPYRDGQAGIWRPLNNWAYIDKRRQQPPASNPANLTQINIDGTYILDEHDWTSNEHLYSPLLSSFNISSSVTKNPYWTFVSEITNYNPYGFVSEKVDALGVYSSVLYGYNNSLKTAEASSSSYYETAFDGFEDYGGGPSPTYNGPHGHINLPGVSSTLSPAEYHTGYYSMPFTGDISLYVPWSGPDVYTLASSPPTSFGYLYSKKYQLSCWVKRYSNVGTISITDPIVTNPTLTLGPIIDGWQKVDFSFTAPSIGYGLSLKISAGAGNTGNCFLDDIRIQPFTSAMKSYVYDPNKLWLLSELDNRNYATFYNYDEEGQVVQVKKETEKGIVTVKTSRNNIRRNPNQ